MKLKKRHLFITIVLVVVLAAVGVAFAWWTTGASIPGNSISSGELAYSAVANDPEDGTVINISGLVPSAGPSASSPKAWFFLENQGDVKTMFYGYLSITEESMGDFRQWINVKITLGSQDTAPGWNRGTWHDLDQAPQDGWPVFDGTLAEIDSYQEGWAELSSRYKNGTQWVRTLFEPGAVAVYKAVFWLDEDTPDQYQGENLKCNINFWGTQEEGWNDEAPVPAP